MSTITSSLSFNELTTYDTENIIKTIPAQRAVQVTIESYTAGEVSDCEIFMSWATSLFKRYGPTQFSDDDVGQLLNIFSTAIAEVLSDCQDCVSETQNAKFLAFLNYSLELFTWVRSVAAEFGTKEITAFVCFGLSTINSYLIVISKQISGMDTSLLVKQSLAIQTVMLGILSENPNTFSFSSHNGSLFGDLMLHLCAVGELTPKLDIRTAVDTWKSITRLASNNLQATSNSSEDTAWLKRPTSFLINEIERNVQTVYKENSLNEPIQQIEKYLKVTNFYLRLLQKLTTDFHHLAFPVCEDFLRTIALVLTPPASIAHTPVHKAIMEYVTKGLRELIPFAYKSDLFFELLLNEQTTTDEAFVVVLLEVIGQAIRRNEVECLNTKLYDAAFDRSLKSSYMFLSSSTYNRFVEIFSSLQIYFHQKQVEDILVKSILQDDLVQALLAVDIWCTIFRVSDHSIRLSYFSFWRDINERFAKFSNRLPALYVEVLLKSLYTFLTAEEKADIWNKFNVNALVNDRFLLAIGLNSITGSAARQSIIQHFTNELLRLLKESPNGMTVDNFYSIVKHLKLLTPTSCRCEKIIKMLLRYLEIALKNKKFLLLGESILDFLAHRLDIIGDKAILKVLTELSRDLSTFNKGYSIKLCLVGFLKNISKNHRLKTHSDELLKIVANDDLTKHFGGIERPTNEKLNPERSKQLLQEILKLRSVGKSDRTHICCIEETSLPVKKKMKIDTEHLLESLANNANDVQALAQLGQLSSSHLERVKRVLSMLRQIDVLS